MSKNNKNKNGNNQKLEAEKAEKERLEKLEAEKAKADSKGKKYKIKSAKELGFEKRNYFIGNKNVLIAAGEEVDEDIYNSFTDKAKEKFFE